MTAILRHYECARLQNTDSSPHRPVHRKVTKSGNREWSFIAKIQNQVPPNLQNSLLPGRAIEYCVALTFKMTEQVEQQICIKFCFKLEHSSTETAFRWFGRPQLWATGDWQLHHDDMPSHAPHFVQSFLAKHQIAQGTQPPYSPDSVPCDFWLFPELKSPLKGKRFETMDEGQ